MLTIAEGDHVVEPRSDNLREILDRKDAGIDSEHLEGLVAASGLAFPARPESIYDLAFSMNPRSKRHESMARIHKRRTRGQGRLLAWKQRLLSSFLITAFLAVHYVHTPLHLLNEDHHDAHVDHSAGHAHAHHSHGPDDEGQPSSHDPHPASDHKLASAVLRSSPSAALNHAFLAPTHLTAFVDPAPRSGPVRVPLLEPRAPPLLSPQQPRAPPAA